MILALGARGRSAIVFVSKWSSLMPDHPTLFRCKNEEEVRLNGRWDWVSACPPLAIKTLPKFLSRKSRSRSTAILLYVVMKRTRFPLSPWFWLFSLRLVVTGTIKRVCCNEHRGALLMAAANKRMKPWWIWSTIRLTWELLYGGNNALYLP